MADIGLKEEIKVSNFFSELGYFTRFHIQLYPRDGKISDIDVFCIKFDNHLFITRNIIETKRSTHSVSTIFQLFGLSKFYKNCNAFFVNDKINYKNFKIAKELGINVYSFERLKKLSEKDKRYKSINIPEEKGLEIVSYIDIIKKNNSNLFWSYHEIWLEKDPFKRLNLIKENFEITDDIWEDNEKNQAFLWLRKELFLLFFISILEITSECIELDNIRIRQYIEDKFYNLGTSKDRKMLLKEGVESLLEIINEKLGEDVDFEFDVIPEWIPNLESIIKKIINQAPFANEYLLLNENVFRSFLIGEPDHVSNFITNKKKYKIISGINASILSLLHKEEVKEDFNDFI
ncbi:MAG: hypothetical protein CIT01_05045 [Methanobacterium sp. BRmetb2]|jgi:hypothetical protein|nr:MAG: hypothetical protein CIT01_05045 [Methanobacterium sp. BRmetb2]